MLTADQALSGEADGGGASKVVRRRDLKWAYWLSLAIGIAFAAASIAGLAFRAAVYPGDQLRTSFAPDDVASLAIGLPALLGCIWLTRRGSLVGLLCWPGALLYVLYNYIAYVVALPFNGLWLLYFALVVLSAGTLVLLVSRIDGQSVRQSLHRSVPARVIGVILAGLGCAFFLRAANLLVTALGSHAPINTAAQGVNVADVLTTPIWIIFGVLLVTRRALGYAFALGVLFEASILFVALLLVLLIQPDFGASRSVGADFIVVFAMSLLCLVPLAIFIRAASRNPMH